MADSIPQLKKDINDLQVKLASAKARIAELEALPERIVEVKVPMPPEVVIEYRDRDVVRVVDRIVTVDNPEHIAEIDRLKLLLAKEKAKPAKIVDVVKEVVKPVAMPPEVIVEYRDRIEERVVYRDNPAHVRLINDLQEKLKGMDQ